MTGKELSTAFLKFFESKGHLVLPSFSLIPKDDPTLLLIGAGMAPLKPFFTGKLKPPCSRVVTNQRCIRTGDIENVGRTARHHTAFMMLGNFSFGDYFKESAIPWAWEFLTEVCELPREKLWISIYPDDDEAEKIWLTQPGLTKERIIRLKDNFWEIGLGPCGPDSEIYIDLGKERGCGKENCALGCECDRFLEIWNLVFTQFEKLADDKYKALERKNIDTGCGLERLASVLQKKTSNFETDLLFPIIKYIESISGVKYGSDAIKDISMKVIADHVRSITFMIMDKILPSNEGRGYVLRRILRRAVRHGRALGIRNIFLENVVDVVVDIYADMDGFSTLNNNISYIKKNVRLEEERFADTLTQGLEVLNHEIERTKNSGKTEFDGEICFKLYDTFGFPYELTEEILNENNLTPNKKIFEESMKLQRVKARTARNVDERIDVPNLSDITIGQLTYDEKCMISNIFMIWKDGRSIEELHNGEYAKIILFTTSFYAEGGGQVGDEGYLNSNFARIRVITTKKFPDGTIYHEVYVEEGFVRVNDEVVLQIDLNKKLSTARNHTATHLLQAALKKVIGNQINQAGSLVTPERLRFDFSSFEPLTLQQIAEVEELVNEEILKATEVDIQQMNTEKAKQLGAMALFDEKYGEIVRVVSIGNFSRELCGGSHVKNVGQIGMFKIIGENGVAAGVRRIEAISGRAVINSIKKQTEILNVLSKLVKVHTEELPKQIENILNENKIMKKQLAKIDAAKRNTVVQELLTKVEKIKNLCYLEAIVSVKNSDELRSISDMLADKLENYIIVLASVNEGKNSLVMRVDKKFTYTGIHAGKILKEVSKYIEGNGGGRPDMAQAGGKNTEGLKKLFEEVKRISLETLFGTL